MMNNWNWKVVNGFDDLIQKQNFILRHSVLDRMYGEVFFFFTTNNLYVK